MSKMHAAIADADAPGRVGLHEVESPTPAPNEALVRVAATSVTPGEVDYSQSGIPGRPIGCDVTGVVEKPAADGSGPGGGMRVVGRLRTGAWAELAAVPTDQLAELPANVMFEEGATLPTSGLTALYVLEKSDRLLGRNVLITAANGSVGLFACQIGKLMGANVIGQVRYERNRDIVADAGADHVLVSDDATAAPQFGPYRLIAEAVGGQVLANCMTMLGRDGICVSYGNVSKADTTFSASSYIEVAPSSLYAFIVSREFDKEPASEGLSRLARLVSEGKLKTQISLEEPVDKIGEIARDVSEHKIAGEAVIRMWI